MAHFSTAYALTSHHEGKYANNPKDRGGETYRGIARKRFPLWSGWINVDAAKNKPNFPANLENDVELQKMIPPFYKANFWNVLNLDAMINQDIANELYDTGVNMGTGRAGLFLQRALNVLNRSAKDYPDLPLTGNVGNMTLTTINNHKNPKLVLKVLNILQGAFYIQLAENNDDQETFVRGWLERVSI